MNAVAQEMVPAGTKTPIQTALEGTYTPVLKILSPDLTVRAAAFIQNLVAHGENAMEQAESANISTEDSFGLAGDLVKAINAKLGEADKARKAITNPMDEAKKSIMKLFSVGIDKLEAAKAKLQKKQTDWAKAERARLDEIARKEQEAATQRALDLAAAQQSLGDNAGADQVMTEAADTIDKMGEVKVSGRGMYGSSSGLRERFVGEVDNPRVFLAWLVTQQYDISTIVDFRKSGLNALAKEFSEKKAAVPGLKIDNVESTVSR
jgi:hypothetical protein